MKLRHNDLIQLRKEGITAIQAKLAELKQQLLTLHKESMGKTVPNPKAKTTTRRNLAQLNTIASELQGVK